MDVIYIGLPFFFWQEDESEHGLDVHVTEGFQKLGFHVYTSMLATTRKKSVRLIIGIHPLSMKTKTLRRRKNSFQNMSCGTISACSIFRQLRPRRKTNTRSSFVIRQSSPKRAASSWQRKSSTATATMKTRIHGAIRRRSSGPATISCHREVRPVPCAWPWAGASPLPARAKNGPMTSRSSVNVSSLRFYKDCWKGAIPFPS